MISFEEIEKEIIKIENTRDTTYATLERLAPLYAAMAYKLISGRTSAEQPECLKVQGDSEFLRVVGGKDPVKVFAVMDELMGAVAALNKNLYEATIEKIKAV